MSVDYFKAPDKIESIVKKVRKRYFKDFRKAKIKTLMRTGKWDKYGTIARVSKKQVRAGIDADYILTLNADEWPKLNHKQRTALVHHELYHMAKRKTKTGVQWRLRHHDVEEFVEIVKRYGKWRQSLVEMAKAMKG